MVRCVACTSVAPRFLWPGLPHIHSCDAAVLLFMITCVSMCAVTPVPPVYRGTHGVSRFLSPIQKRYDWGRLWMHCSVTLSVRLTRGTVLDTQEFPGNKPVVVHDRHRVPVVRNKQAR